MHVSPSSLEAIVYSTSRPGDEFETDDVNYYRNV